ncbi:MAG: DUF952 domain-containing protein [Cucumibacter sp.]
MRAATAPNGAIYKVMTSALWQASVRGEVVLPMPVDTNDGFMHLSARDQLEETLRVHFAGQRDLELVAIDPIELGMGLAWEPSRGGALFPHLYAPCPMRAVLWHAPLEPARDGGFILPAARG